MNCHVIAAPSMVAMFENFVSVTQEEDVPQVSHRSAGSSRAVFMGTITLPLLLYLCLAQEDFRDSNLGGLASACSLI